MKENERDKTRGEKKKILQLTMKKKEPLSLSSVALHFQ